MLRLPVKDVSDLPEYVPPGEWPSEAWDELLDRYFEKALDAPEPPATHRYVLLRIPVDVFDRLEARAVGRAARQET